MRVLHPGSWRQVAVSARRTASISSPWRVPRLILSESASRNAAYTRTRQLSTTQYLHQNQPTSLNNTQNAETTSQNDTSSKSERAPEGSLSIVFTDIVQSTQLWELAPLAMKTAMQLHDSILRTLIDTHSGYEVKQNGDGFMITFPTAISALQFCLTTQQRLIDQDWPEELLELKPSKETDGADGTVLFRGLRLRMSAHWGQPVCVWNDVIERMDYLGPVVNRAARFIQVTEGGQIVVSEEFLVEVQKAKRGDNSQHRSHGESGEPLDLEDLQCSQGPNIITDQEFEVKLLGEHQFKGLSEPQKLYFIIPESLHGRLDNWPKHKYIPGSKGNIIPSNS